MTTVHPLHAPPARDEGDRPSPSAAAETVLSPAVIAPAERRRSELKALSWAALLAAGVALYIVQPIAIGILLGTLLGFIAQPLSGRLQRRLGLRASALITVALATALVAAFVVGLGWLLTARGTVHLKELIDLVGPKGSDGALLAQLSAKTRPLGISTKELADKLRDLGESAVSRVAVGASLLFAATASTLLALFFMMMSMHFVLRHVQTLIRVTKDTSPLRPEWTLGLFTEFRRVGKATLFGTVVTGFAQGVLAGAGFWLFDVPDPLFYGALTAVASLVPAVGTLLVWVPAGVVLLSTGHVAGGVGTLLWGALVVVALSDYVIRPHLVRGESEMPSLVTFAALFGGVEVFGLKGLLVGPLLMSLAVAVLRLYARETAELRTAPESAAGPS